MLQLYRILILDCIILYWLYGTICVSHDTDLYPTLLHMAVIGICCDWLSASVLLSEGRCTIDSASILLECMC